MNADSVFFFVALLAVCFPLHFIRKALQQRSAEDDSARRAAERRHRRRRARSGNADLFAPLLANSAVHHQHRLDAALRDADEGYNRCPTCDFANFKRLARCSLCGASVSLPAEFVDRLVRAASTRSSRSATASSSASSRRGSKSVSFALPPMRAEPLAQALDNKLSSAATETPEPIAAADGGGDERPLAELTERQLRAIKRKEWTRKIDVKGAVFWYRDSCQGAVDLRFPGFTARFEPKRRRAAVWAADDVDIDALSVSPTAPSSVTDSASELELPLATPCRHQPLLSDDDDDASLKAASASGGAALTLGQRALELEHDTLPVEIRLTDATVVDAARFPLYCDRADPQLTWKEVLRIAARSFPTKYAHFATAAAALSAAAGSRRRGRGVPLLRVRRAALFEDAAAALSALPAADVRAPLRVRFVAERDGCDERDAAPREWIVAFSEQLFDPRRGVFRCVDAGAAADAAGGFYLNPDSRLVLGERHLAFVFAAGRFVGRALLDGHALGFRLALPLRKLLLGVPIAFPDLEAHDPALFRQLAWLLTHDVEPLGLDFSEGPPRLRAHCASNRVDVPLVERREQLQQALEAVVGV
ncbi:hypothetical protein PybrP1_004421 [[Pythium] brassicae (nom. inval.)]|nr:hypothetical protein PybrP1_004421 [[Pythium] brassicae (nom. inval.)]